MYIHLVCVCVCVRVCVFVCVTYVERRQQGNKTYDTTYVQLLVVAQHDQ